MKKLKQLVKEGKYNYINPLITEGNFPIPDKIQTENWKIIYMNKLFSSQEALDKMKAEGCRPANIYELATWKINHGEELKKGRWLLAFGQTTILDGYHEVPSVYASYTGGDFDFSLDDFEDGWDDRDCLLCFSDLEPKTLESLALRVSALERKMESLGKFLVF